MGTDGIIEISCTISKDTQDFIDWVEYLEKTMCSVFQIPRELLRTNNAVDGKKCRIPRKMKKRMKKRLKRTFGTVLVNCILNTAHRMSDKYVITVKCQK